jgi:hypothetical protein
MSTPFDPSTRTLLGNELPRQPSAAAKELIFSYRGSQFVMLLIGLIFLAVGAPLSLVFNAGLVGDVQLSARGVKGHATVESMRVNRNVRINNEHPTTVTFAYQVHGVTYRDETDTRDHALLASAAAGSPVPIEYLEADPPLARLAGESRSTMGYWGLFVFLFPGVGLAMLGGAVRSNRREVRAYRYGQPVPARVVSFAEDLGTRVNGRHPWVLRWEFTVSGATYSGSLSSMRPHELAPYAEEKQVTVLMMPDDPKVNTLFVP